MQGRMARLGLHGRLTTGGRERWGLRWFGALSARTAVGVLADAGLAPSEPRPPSLAARSRGPPTCPTWRDG